jgi:hypothetical protein
VGLAEHRTNRVRIYERDYWLPDGASRRSPATVDRSDKTELFIHYSAFAGMETDTIKECVAVMRAIRHQHVNVNGWADIGYHLVFFQARGKLTRTHMFEGRPLNRIPAAQENHNTGTIAFCVVTLDERIKDATVGRLKWAYKTLTPDTCRTVRPHSDVVATRCPGPKLKARLLEIAAAKR